MNEILKFDNLQDCILEIRDQKVLLDVDVAEIYGVETKRINEAVKNNPDKFPSGYIIELDKTEWDGVKSKFSTSIVSPLLVKTALVNRGRLPRYELAV